VPAIGDRGVATRPQHPEVDLSRLAFPALALLLAGCGNPDSQVFNGILGRPPNVPNAYIDSVGSAIAGVSQRTDAKGVITKIDVFVLTNRNDLCKKLGDKPDYLDNPSEPFVALAMATPFDRLGTFQAGASDGLYTWFGVTAGPGAVVTRYPPYVGALSVRQFDARAGGESQGSFDIYFIDLDGAIHEIFGRFKTTTCDALKNVTFTF
jgi:hypothetical protein